jgi:hypothetical protein
MGEKYIRSKRRMKFKVQSYINHLIKKRKDLNVYQKKSEKKKMNDMNDLTRQICPYI